MLIYLLRHGQTEYNAQKRYQGQRDIPLSPEGAAQLRRADFDPDVVYVSTLQRTSQTARILFPEAKLVPFFPYFEQTAPLEACTEKLKQASRNYAKRQLTWFRHMDGVVWLDAGAPDAVQTAIRKTSEFLAKG